MTTVNLEYYARLREQAGASFERVETTAVSLRELYNELSARHGFTPSLDGLKVAVNAQFGAWEQPPREGDTIVFIPPVGGG